MSQIWCRDQDFELPHDEIHCVRENRILSCQMMKILIDNKILSYDEILP